MAALFDGKATHAAAQQLCYETHGDWRYDPGDDLHAVYFEDATAALKAAVAALDTDALVEKAAAAVHDGKGCTCRHGARGDARAMLVAVGLISGGEGE